MKSKIPEIIYLQINGDENIFEDGFDEEQATWCSDRIFESDIKYIRFDKVTVWPDGTIYMRGDEE